MDAADVEARRRQLDVHVVGVDPPNPVTRFGQCGGLGASTLKVLKRIGYDAPTAIQAQAIPALLSGRDVLGIAKTGSGKTASFALPALVHAMDQRTLRRGDGPIVLVLAPVRELAAQILSEFRRFAKAHEGLRCVGVLGGGSKTDNFRELRNGAEVVVGTPGRLVDVCRGGTQVGYEFTAGHVSGAGRGGPDAGHGVRGAGPVDMRRVPAGKTDGAVLGDDAGARASAVR